jgi:Asp-tRNA(Asn)/Glu-tRNA(Gln) amidotransferase A subunit family amidase
LHQPGLQRALQLAEHRERGEHRQRHRKERHQRNGGGEGEAAGRQAQAVLAEALAQRQRGGAPRKHRQVLQELAKVHRRYDAIAMPTTLPTPPPPLLTNPMLYLRAAWPWAACWA